MLTEGILWGGSINGGTKMGVKGGLCDGSLHKLPSVEAIFLT